MILEMLALKGLVALGKAAIATKTAGPVFWGIKASTATFGAAQTAGAVFAVGIVAGGVCWTVDRINNLKDGLDNLSKGNNMKAAYHFGSLAISANLDVDLLPDAVHKYMINSGFASASAEQARREIIGIEDKIIQAMNTRSR